MSDLVGMTTNPYYLAVVAALVLIVVCTVQLGEILSSPVGI